MSSLVQLRVKERNKLLRLTPHQSWLIYKNMSIGKLQLVCRCVASCVLVGCIVVSNVYFELLARHGCTHELFIEISV